MGQTICSCGDPKFGNLGRPNCIIEMKAIAFPVIFPRFNDVGVRNTIDVTSATLGSDLLALVQPSNPAQNRIYPFPRMENVTEERTDTTYETAASGRKYLIEGVGEVRTWMFELWGKDAANQILRELNKYGCSELDFFLVDIAGTLWGIKDEINGDLMRGYEMSTETFNAFRRYATDTTTQKIMISWDVDNGECEENSYGVTSEELVATGGVKATSLKGLISAFQTVSALTATDLQTIVYTGFGSAGDRGKVVGLAPANSAANFTAFNETTQLAVTLTSATETADGEYTLVMSIAQTATDPIKISVAATGYDVADNSVLAI
tara:strand:+ start:1368 stop:2330 length:963 start_codon:yes stop_codon:yes gene_type:complete